MTDATRPLPPMTPLSHGGWEVRSLLSSTDYTIRGLGLMPPNSIVPVIVVPGIMGTNLRARVRPIPDEYGDGRNPLAAPGSPVWRAPNGLIGARKYAGTWDRKPPKDRQTLLDASTLEVDDSGPIAFSAVSDGYLPSESEARERGWGEVHAASYARLLCALQTHLNQTFGFNDVTEKRFVKPYWQSVMRMGERQWGGKLDPLTEAQLTRHVAHYYPAYAFGYNWLDDCAVSARRLERRIAEIVSRWKEAKRQCDQVILITHSMGGLVARACAKRIPERIAGVIHGVMPAYGAPVAYRRLACGAEADSHGHGTVVNYVTDLLAQLQGDTAEKTTPVMAVAPGILELLPNHLHPQPWLHVRSSTGSGARPSGQPPPRDGGRQREVQADYLHLPGSENGNPYALYRDMTSWYRLIDPALVDPSGVLERKRGGAAKAIRAALAAAEHFHRWLGEHYHPTSYAFYGADPRKLTYSALQWRAHWRAGTGLVMTPANVAAARRADNSNGTRRRVVLDNRNVVEFELEPQDGAGDGTVSQLSGAGPAGKVRQLFRTGAIEHQNAFNDERMLALTLRLVVEITQEVP